MKNKVNLNKTLEQLENDYWGEPQYDSLLVTTCLRLRKKPLKDLGIEDLRILIGQNFSLEFLIPLAIDRLKSDIMVSGDFYEGDLLKAVLTSDTEYWYNHSKNWVEVCELVLKNIHQIKSSLNTKKITDEILKEFESFKNII